MLLRWIAGTNFQTPPSFLNLTFFVVLCAKKWRLHNFHSFFSVPTLEQIPGKNLVGLKQTGDGVIYKHHHSRSFPTWVACRICFATFRKQTGDGVIYKHHHSHSCPTWVACRICFATFRRWIVCASVKQLKKWRPVNQPPPKSPQIAYQSIGNGRPYDQGLLNLNINHGLVSLKKSGS